MQREEHVRDLWLSGQALAPGRWSREQRMWYCRLGFGLSRLPLCDGDGDGDVPGVLCCFCREKPPDTHSIGRVCLGSVESNGPDIVTLPLLGLYVDPVPHFHACAYLTCLRLIGRQPTRLHCLPLPPVCLSVRLVQFSFALFGQSPLQQSLMLSSLNPELAPESLLRNTLTRPDVQTADPSPCRRQPHPSRFGCSTRASSI